MRGNLATLTFQANWGWGGQNGPASLTTNRPSPAHCLSVGAMLKAYVQGHVLANSHPGRRRNPASTKKTSVKRKTKYMLGKGNTFGNATNMLKPNVACGFLVIALEEWRKQESISLVEHIGFLKIGDPCSAAALPQHCRGSLFGWFKGGTNRKSPTWTESPLLVAVEGQPNGNKPFWASPNLAIKQL